MESQAHIKEPHKLRRIESAAKCNQRRLRQLIEESESGFTLIEMLVVVIIIAVLSAIAAPSWLAFLNRQRVSKVNDAVFSAIQSAQREAKRTKYSYSVSFRVDPTSGLLQAAVYPVVGSPLPTPATLPANTWQPLNQNLGINSGQVILGSNLSGENTYSSTLSYLASTATSPTPPITFDYMGSLSSQPNQPSLGSNGLIITVAIPQSAQSTQPIVATQRCVIVKTLLGSLQTAQDTGCNAQ